VTQAVIKQQGEGRTVAVVGDVYLPGDLGRTQTASTPCGKPSVLQAAVHPFTAGRMASTSSEARSPHLDPCCTVSESPKYHLDVSG
jgi:hypothetical protein